MTRMQVMPAAERQSAALVENRTSALAGFAACTLLVAALLLGGGTRNHLFSDLLVQLLAAVLLFEGARRLRWQELQPAARQLLVVLLCVLALPLLQLLPLPRALVELAPGRAALYTQQAQLGLAVPAFVPWSLDANATLAALRGLLPAAAMAVLGLRLDPLWLRRLALIVVVAALLMVPIGIAQVAQGPHSELRPYLPTNPHDAVGLFANRNHYAGLLTVALVFVLGSMILDARPRRAHAAVPLRLLGWMLAGAILLVGVALSRSRAGFGLSLLVALVMLAIAWMRRREHAQTFRWLVAFVIVGGLVAFQFGFLAIADRLTQAADQRWDITGSVLQLAGQFGWLGTGLGSFPAAYAAYEPIELVGSRILNHAHNDWAELWVELGVLLLVPAALFLRFAWGRARELAASATLVPTTHALRLIGLATCGVLALHSLVDYPLRTTALSTVFALACVMAVQPLLRRGEAK